MQLYSEVAGFTLRRRRVAFGGLTQTTLGCRLGLNLMADLATKVRVYSPPLSR